MKYFDDGVSGSIFEGRGAFQRMLKDARDGKFQCLIVKDFSRLGRDYIEVGNFMEYVFPAMGLRFISVNDHYDSSAGRGMAGGTDAAFKNLLHQMYAMDGSKKVKTAKRTRNERGEYTAPLVPYGYRKDPEDVHRLVIDDGEAAVVREIFMLAADGTGLGRIARTLNDRGEPTPYEKKCGNGIRKERKGVSGYHVWGMPAIRQIIRNASYKGQMVQNRYETVGYGGGKKCVLADREKWNVIDGAVPAIVSEELFEAANANRKPPRNTHTAERETNLFVCAHCGRKLVKTSPNGRYVCPVRKVKSHTVCGTVDLKVGKARTMVLQTVKELAIAIIRSRDYYAESEKRRLKEIDMLMKRCEEEKERLERCVLASYEEYHDGILSRESYIEGRKSCRAAIDGLDARMDALRDELHAAVRVDDGAMLECRFLQEYDGRTLAKVVEKVRIYDGRKMDIVFGADDIFKAEAKEEIQ